MQIYMQSEKQCALPVMGVNFIMLRPSCFCEI